MTRRSFVAAALAAIALGAAVATPAPADAQERRGFSFFPGRGTVDLEAQRQRAADLARRGPSNRPILGAPTGTLSYGGRQPLLVRKQFPDGGSTVIFF